MRNTRMSGTILASFALLTATLWIQPSPARACGARNLEDQQTSRVTLRVDGMTCASCAAAIKVRLEKLDGVGEATVSFGDKRARVVYDATKVTQQ